ncbi:MAG: type II toxin-antitoxin system RelE family toxin, partial [Planctomycetota bacterium]
KRIEALQQDPRPANGTLLDSGKKIYRVRSGNYRIVYQVEDRVLLVIVAAVGHRKDVYEALRELRKAL